MNIKHLKPNPKSKYKQGYFKLNENHKYVGSQPIIYRSSLEKKFCIYCENNKGILKWASEPFHIKYLNPITKKYNKYFPDFYVETENGDKIIIEIKPKDFLNKPTPPKRKTTKSMKNYKNAYETWEINMSKFVHMKKYAKNNGFKFKIITEEFFKHV